MSDLPITIHSSLFGITMLKSMTGFGRSELNTDLGYLTVEIKSVNHKYCNITLHIAPQLSSFEIKIHNFIKSQISRGQINLSLEIRAGGDASHADFTLDLQLAKKYYQELSGLRDELGLKDEITLEMFTRLPGVLVFEEEELGENRIWHSVEELLKTAIEGLNLMKETEGASLSIDLNQRLETVKTFLSQIKLSSSDFVREYHEKLKKRLEELLKGKVEIDESRIIMEAGVLAERADITEEIVRIESHCEQFAGGIASDEPVGRQLDFLLQEMLREANTIGSKVGQPEIASNCVLLKTEIEKMRELTQNIE